MKHTDIKRQDGFSIVQLSIVMMIAGLLMAGFLQLYHIQEKQRRLDATEYAIFTVTDSLSKYLSRNGRFPCPARTDLNASSAQYGEETDCTNTSVGIGSCSGGYCVTTRAGSRIRIGMLPFKDLDIGREDIIDGYKNRFTYVVNEVQATAGYTEGAGTIMLLDMDSAGSPITENVDMLFFSHGANGAGATRSSGTANATACNEAGMDRENCDMDAMFVSDARAHSNLASGTYDDKLVADIWSWIYIWDETTDDANSIYNRDIGNMGVGTENPTEKLHVASGDMRIETADMQSVEICNSAGTNCFDPDDLGGTGMACDDAGQFMIGIANRGTLCRSVLGEATGGCSGNTFVSGFTFTSSGLTTVTCRDAVSGTDVGTVNVN